MKWRTEVIVKKMDIELDYSAPMMFAGSCFATNMESRMSRLHFDVRPFSHGVIFHPSALARAFQEIAGNKTYSAQNLFLSDSMFRSLAHHGSFSNRDSAVAIQNINHAISNAHLAIGALKLLVVTFGTSYGYRHLETNCIVANCHKLPQSTFVKELVDENAMLLEWKQTIASLRMLNPNLRFVFTVSPVRHWKDGAVENSRSKARLISLCAALVELEGVDYFPSYEIMMDDLRDYRFYESDMLHPNVQAIDYIQEQFVEAAFSRDSKSKILRIEKLVQLSEHRSIHELSETTEKRKAEALEGIRLIIEE
ncbi:MAG: GSCFA domain-containing protein [Flavobacteriales bacterium]